MLPFISLAVLFSVSYILLFFADIFMSTRKDDDDDDDGLLKLFIVGSQRGSEPVHSYSARFADGKLMYNGTVYEHGQQILIETRNSPAVQYVSDVAFF